MAVANLLQVGKTRIVCVAENRIRYGEYLCVVIGAKETRTTFLLGPLEVFLEIGQAGSVSQIQLCKYIGYVHEIQILIGPIYLAAEMMFTAHLHATSIKDLLY